MRDLEYYLDRARCARQLADTVDPDQRAAHLRMAAAYEAMAAVRKRLASPATANNETAYQRTG
jgi:hypothetical protein